jgi:PIN like domain
MRSLFAGYYRPSDKEFDELWKNCTFVFDASVLLDLYRSTATTRGVLISILEKIKDRLWLPYQAAWEYQENRLDVIAKERELYSELRKTLDGLVKNVQQKMHNHAVESAEKIKGELDGSIKKIIAIIDQGASEHPDLIAKDYIREKITQLFDGRVGKKLDEKRLASIYQEGPKRYEQKIPPGFEDFEKGGTRQFGDLVIWNEILEKAKASEHPIIFVTSDTKEDWWWKQGQFTVGPRPELVQEVADFAKVAFYMYNVERFVNEAQKRLDTNVEPTEVKKAAEEFKDIESKRETTAESETLSRDLFYLWEQAGLLSPKQPDKATVQGFLARFLDSKELAQMPGAGAGLLSLESMIQTFEKLENRKISDAERETLQRTSKNGTLANLISGAKTFKDVTRLISLFLDLSLRSQSNK